MEVQRVGQKVAWEPYVLEASDLSLWNAAKLLSNGREAFPAMLDALKAARRQILLEIYTFSEDATGRRFSEALKERAKAGVQVRVLYDAIGCLETSTAFFADMRSAGVEVIEYHPLVPWKPYWNWFRRNHRKMLAVDGTTAFIGGLNLSLNDAPPEWGGHGWRDTEVRLEGPCVGLLEELFWSTWRAAGGSHASSPAERGPAPGNLPVRIVSSTGLANRRSIRRSYLHAIDRARRFIGITNAYFLPGRSLYRRLIRAAGRGVRVAVIVPYETDHPWVRWASWALYGRLLKGGVEIHEYQGRVLHAKTAVIDGLWSAVGSHNLDHRSLRFNLEVAVNIFGPEFGALMTERFENDLRHCRRVTFEDWSHLPFPQKLVSEILYDLRYLL